MSEEYKDKINNHYAKENLFGSIVTAINDSGLDIDNLKREDISSFEEFHVGGRDATRYLAEFVQLESGLYILDVGCGIGGPARTLADEYNCKVTGIDITKEYIHTATELSKLVGLHDKVSFKVESGTSLSFESDSFDVVWMQHVNMNIAEKDELFKEVYRVLKPFGRLIFYEILKQNDEPIDFPVLWATTPELSFLINENEFREKLQSTGLVESQWEDRTLFAIEWFEHLSAQKKKEESDKLNLSQVTHTDIPQKVANVLHNLKEQKICVVQAVYSKS